jgi:hypothetical protein
LLYGLVLRRPAERYGTQRNDPIRAAETAGRASTAID